MSDRTGGTIKRLVTDRGFGFIQIDGTDDEIFFHRSNTKGDRTAAEFDRMHEGQRVTFLIKPSPKGPRAEQVEFDTVPR